MFIAWARKLNDTSVDSDWSWLRKSRLN